MSLARTLARFCANFGLLQGCFLFSPFRIRFIGTLVLWCEVMKEISNLSKIFQQDNVSFDLIEQNVAKTVEFIAGHCDMANNEKQRLTSQPSSPCTDRIIAEVEKEIARLKEYGITVVDGPQQRLWFASTRAQWLAALRDRLRARFPSTALFTDLATLLVPQQLPVDIKTSVRTKHGAAALERIIAAFSAPPVPERTLEEQLRIAAGASKKAPKQSAVAAASEGKEAKAMADVDEGTACILRRNLTGFSRCCRCGVRVPGAV